MDSKSEIYYGDILVCPECGKKFYCANLGDWAYKRTRDFQRKVFCSWTCVRKFDKRAEEAAAASNDKSKANHWRGRRIAT